MAVIHKQGDALIDTMDQYKWTKQTKIFDTYNLESREFVILFKCSINHGEIFYGTFGLRNDSILDEVVHRESISQIWLNDSIPRTNINS